MNELKILDMITPQTPHNFALCLIQREEMIICYHQVCFLTWIGLSKLIYEQQEPQTFGLRISVEKSDCKRKEEPVCHRSA